MLAWEDNAEGGQYDVYFTFLDDSGQPDAGRIPQNPNDAATRRVVKVSDTPQDTQGFSVSPAQDGAFIVWQSLDEVNSDNLNISLVKITLEGASLCRLTLTPLIRNGRYVAHALSEGNPITSLDTVSMAWAYADIICCAGKAAREVLSRLTLIRPTPTAARCNLWCQRLAPAVQQCLLQKMRDALDW